MAYKDKEAIAANGSQSLTQTKLVDGVRSALVSAQGGNFTYDYHGDTIVANQGHPLYAGSSLVVNEDELQQFRVIRNTADTGSLYVTYMDRPANMSNWRGSA